MNIFWLSFIPKECAQWHGDRHLIKMILETVQLLCTAYRILTANTNQEWITRCEQESGKSPTRSTHPNHPCCIWTRAKAANFKWLTILGLELCREKKVRLPARPQHTYLPLLIWLFKNPPDSNLFADRGLDTISVPPMAIADNWDCKLGDLDPYEEVLSSYRKYYRAKELVGIVYYQWLPDRRPTWLDNYNIPESRLQIIRASLNK